MRCLTRLLCLSLAALLLAACNRSTTAPIPTQASIDALATETVLTQNAPPPGWREPVAFPEVDLGLRELAGWRYEVQMQFDGVFARTSRRASAATIAEVWFNQLASSRRVTVNAKSDLGGQLEQSYEAVRLGPDTFLVQNNVCLDVGGAAAVQAADLSAGALVGGVKNAFPAPQRAIINGEEVWRYDFDPNDLLLPQIDLRDDGRILYAVGELWIAPAHGVVVRFYVNLDVENASIFGSTLPVSGQVILRYDLFDIARDISAAPNITVPFGC